MKPSAYHLQDSGDEIKCPYTWEFGKQIDIMWEILIGFWGGWGEGVRVPG